MDIDVAADPQIDADAELVALLSSPTGPAAADLRVLFDGAAALLSSPKRDDEDLQPGASAAANTPGRLRSSGRVRSPPGAFRPEPGRIRAGLDSRARVRSPGRVARARPQSAGAASARRPMSRSGSASLGSSFKKMQEDGQNPFSQANTRFLREADTGIPSRSNGSSGRKSGVVSRVRSPSPVRSKPSRKRRVPPEEAVLQGLAKLEKGAVEQGGQQLEDAVADLGLDKLSWFLRVAFEDRKRVLSTLARRRLLLCLPCIVRQSGLAIVDSGDLEKRILPILVSALQGQQDGDAAFAEDGVLARGLVESVARALAEIFDSLVSDGDADRFSKVGEAILMATFDPLVLGRGWDMPAQRRCVRVLSLFTPILLQGAAGLGAGAEPLLQSFSLLLVQCLAVHNDMHEGLLTTVESIAANSPAILQPHQSQLVELCIIHLTRTQPAGGKALPGPLDASVGRTRRGLLTSKLALACVNCLGYLAGEDLKEQWESVAKTLKRENLNLHRLARGNDELRRAIAFATDAWEDLFGAS